MYIISASSLGQSSHQLPSIYNPRRQKVERERERENRLHSGRSSVAKMGLSMKQMALLTSFFGAISFICGVIAENKKPATGTPIQGKDVIICKYPSDPTVALGYISVVALIASTVFGYMSISYPYNRRSIPYSALFRSKTMLVFFNIAWLTAGLAAALLLWPTITEQLHLSRKVHYNKNYTCPTAKTGLIGGGAFVSLDSCLFWLICLMLTDNAREDYFEEIEESQKRTRTQVINVNLNGGSTL